MISKLYEHYHRDRKLQKRIIDARNFTYRDITSLLEPYLINQELHILDIGCGVGTIDFWLANQGHTIDGIDISHKAIKRCKENALNLSVSEKTSFYVSNFPDSLPKECKGPYDIIIFSEVIEHLKNDQVALKEIFTLLAPGGIVFITTPSSNAPLFRLGLLKDFDKEVGHERRYSMNELVQKIHSAQFEILETRKREGIIRNFLFTNRFAGKLIRYIRWIISDMVAFFDAITIPLFGESNLVVIAQKPKK